MALSFFLARFGVCGSKRDQADAHAGEALPSTANLRVPELRSDACSEPAKSGRNSIAPRPRAQRGVRRHVPTATLAMASRLVGISMYSTFAQRSAKER